MREASRRHRRLRTGMLRSLAVTPANFAVLFRVKEHSKDTYDHVTILGRATGRYNSHFDIDPEDCKRPGRPKDKIPWILININFIAPSG